MGTFNRLIINYWLKLDRGFKTNMSFSDIDKLTCDFIIDDEKKN